jgi:hypothetical protein
MDTRTPPVDDVTRWTSRDCCVGSHRSLPVVGAPLVVQRLLEQGPGHSAVPVRDGWPFPGAAKSCSTRMARLRNGVRPSQTTSGPPLSMSQWPNSTGVQDSPEKAGLSITPAHRATSMPRSNAHCQRPSPRPSAPEERKGDRVAASCQLATRSRGTRQITRQFLRDSERNRQGKRRPRWLSPSDRNWLSFRDRYQRRP